MSTNRQHGKALRRYMRAKGIKRQRELAKEFGVSEATISRHFAGTRSFSPDLALRISRKIGVPMEELFQ
jgi:plasmid maintenance system antidote protein VapI